MSKYNKDLDSSIQLNAGVLGKGKDHLHAEMFGFPFRWEDYDQFKVHIDEAYEKYQKKTTGSST